MCIMAGCDFLPSLPGIGAKKAHGLMKKFRSFVKASGVRLKIQGIR
jgi:exonuclease-1